MPVDKLHQYQIRLLSHARGNDNNADRDSDDGDASDASLDELLDELDGEDDEFIQKYREQRLQQIATDMRTIKENVETEQYGQVTTVTEEREVIRLTASSNQVVIHFALDTFRKCSTMDSKLSQLASKHLLTQFIRVSVDKCPFLVAKLQIKVLPFVIAYNKGVERTRIVGFSKLGNQPEDFDVAVLENILFQAGVLANKSRTSHESRWKASKGRGSDSDSDLDL
ncbi:LANO_0G08240g1_1 [Lachancea nothofagi CBS 11611]|uniref:LANO_0G08240g1_1 n=1 Tax=Lachancea nothofagi CBS 11611 TaxID=1266666 RepID=A0A1G4KI94_9SACH|nr:LANO_0G08240g1_1 [Lachancea nothofagi CBS 11611]